MRASVVFWATATLLILATGVALVLAPAVAWILTGAFVGIALLQAGPSIWIMAALLAATLSRLPVAMGFAPALLNFVHFPLTLGALLTSAGRRGWPRPLTRSLAAGMSGLLLLSFVSWAVNGGELIRPLLNWLVFCEPFLLILALSMASFGPGVRERLWKLVLAIATVQLPLAIWQALSYGVGDRVQGSFIGQGAGHHVAGTVALVGVLVCVAKAATKPNPFIASRWALAAVSLFSVSILSDTKQSVIAFVPALLVVVSGCTRITQTRALTRGVVMAAVILVTAALYPPMRQAMDWPPVRHGLAGKVEGMRVVVRSTRDNPTAWLVGLGPGNTVSRVGLLSIEGHVNQDSPVYLLGLRLSPVTEQLLPARRTLWNLSSVWSPISSWLGLFGDLGLIGIAIYLWLGWKVWRGLGRKHAWQTSAGKGSVVMMALLGLLYSWLEEPGVTLPTATVAGLALGMEASTLRTGALLSHHALARSRLRGQPDG